MVSSLPQRQDHLRTRYRALLESAWGRPGIKATFEPPRLAALAIRPPAAIPAPDPQPKRVAV